MLETENFSLTGKVETGLGHLEVLENQEHHRQPEQQHQHTVSFLTRFPPKNHE